MNIDLEFETAQTYQARLDSFESILAAVVDLLVSGDRPTQDGLAERLDLLRRWLRTENAHSEAVETVERFYCLVKFRD